MKICTKCNREYLDNLNFCSKCGDRLIEKPQEYFCPSCNKSLGKTFDKFCPYCGLMFGKIEDTSRDAFSNIVANEHTAHANDSISKPYKASKMKYLFSFKGRRSRGEAFIADCIISILMMGTFFLFALVYPKANKTVAAIVLVPTITPLLIAGIANKVKRAHDFNKSGWWLLGCCLIVAIVGAVLKMVDPVLQEVCSFLAPFLLYMPKGTDGVNKYGA